MKRRARPVASVVGVARAGLDLLYPRVCAVCGRHISRVGTPLCDLCLAHIERAADWQCERCGAQGYGDPPQPGRRCSFCPPEDAPCRGFVCVTGFHDVSAQCIHLFKYRRRLAMGRLMAHTMAERLAEPFERLVGRLDCVAPVPLHWRRAMTRGFNQSAVLARTIAGVWGVEYRPRLLRRTRHTRQQALIESPEERLRNILGAFAVGRGRAARVEGLGVLLVDDVVTSGATVQESARMLREAGAREVWAAGFAHTRMGPPRRDV